MGGYLSISDPGQEYKPKPMPEYQRENDGDYGYTPDPSPSSLPSDYEYSDMQSLINAMRRDGIDVDKIIQEAKAMNLNHINLNPRNRNWNDKSLFDVGSQDDKSLFEKLKQYYIQYRDALRNNRSERREQIRDYMVQKQANRKAN